MRASPCIRPHGDRNINLITCVRARHEGFTVCWHALRPPPTRVWRDRCVVGVCAVWLQLLKVLEGHTGSVWDVAVSGDGSRIVSGSADKTVRIWSADSGQVPHRSAPCWPLLCVCAAARSLLLVWCGVEWCRLRPPPPHTLRPVHLQQTRGMHTMHFARLLKSWFLFSFLVLFLFFFVGFFLLLMEFN